MAVALLLNSMVRWEMAVLLLEVRMEATVKDHVLTSSNVIHKKKPNKNFKYYTQHWYSV